MLLNHILIKQFLNLGKKLPSKLKNFIWICIAGLRLKALFWHLKGDQSDLYRHLGFQNCKKLFGISNRYHKKILKEKDFNIRATLYHELYEQIYNFGKQHIPPGKEFGFDPHLINEFKDLFRNRAVIDYGCGKGASSRLISKYAKFVYGIDASDLAIRSAQAE